MATTPDYSINYEDERFADVKTEETQQLTELEQTYNGMIGSSDKFYQDQIDASNAWAEQQKQLQQEQTDFTIEQIEQQKEQAAKDYTKEQAGAYVDWRKQSNQYGTEAEKMASAGLDKTGFAESSQVSMYNTYQNRVATARESFNQAVLNYNNAIKDARLQNNAALAEIAANALQTQLELSLQGFQYKNQLILDLSDKKMQTKQFYADQWQRVLDQMNKENDRQWQTDQNALEREWKSAEAFLDREFQFKRDDLQRKFEAEQAELNRKHDKAMLEAKTKAEKELLEEQHKKDLEKLQKQHEYDMAQLDKQLANQKSLAAYENSLKSGVISGGGGGGGTGGIPKSGAGIVYRDLYNSTKSSSGSSSSGGSSSGGSSSGKTTKATMDSITALGYGAVSAAKLNSLVASGKVIEYTKNGVTLFKNATPKLPTTKLSGTKSSAISLPTSKLRK